ncbi:hypothetical protein TNCV_4644671 [Trichonephila clavipes]|nr:hypothetical protein TNCV_4644671 [Trichonephila clavipes]
MQQLLYFDRVYESQRSRCCDEVGLFPLIVKSGSDRRGKISDVSLISGKEFHKWVVKNCDNFIPGSPDVKKRLRNIVISFSHDSVTTARLRLPIGGQRAREQMCRDQLRTQGWSPRVRTPTKALDFFQYCL